MAISYEQESRELAVEVYDLEPVLLPAFLEKHKEVMDGREQLFPEYMRMKFREKGILQQNVFLAADLPERYGYKLISGQKHTRQRDVILRICLAAKFDLGEVQKALNYYGMAPLHSRVPRDVVFIVAFQHRIYDIHEVDTMLRENELPPFLT